MNLLFYDSFGMVVRPIPIKVSRFHTLVQIYSFIRPFRHDASGKDVKLYFIKSKSCDKKYPPTFTSLEPPKYDTIPLPIVMYESMHANPTHRITKTSSSENNTFTFHLYLHKQTQSIRRALPSVNSIIDHKNVVAQISISDTQLDENPFQKWDRSLKTFPIYCCHTTEAELRFNLKVNTSHCTEIT